MVRRFWPASISRRYDRRPGSLSHVCLIAYVNRPRSGGACDNLPGARMSRHRSPEAAREPPFPGRRAVGLAVLAGVGWAWAAGLLATREHELVHYFVLVSAPRAWGLIGLPLWQLSLFAGLGGGLALGCFRAARLRARDCPPATAWVLVAYAIPLWTLRLAGLPLPMTLLEPLLFCWLTGNAVAALARGTIADHQPESPAATRRWLAAIWLLAALAAAWWCWQGLRAYDDYLLGYHDFGHFAHRVANTWAGRGFLKETPSLPAFWDHFNPGLALLAPAWGLWPDARLFVVLQAVCLALPAPLVFGIARAWGAGAAAAAAWAAAYLVYPATGQLNLNYTYGWHPVSLALPLFFLALWGLREDASPWPERVCYWPAAWRKPCLSSRPVWLPSAVGRRGRHGAADRLTPRRATG